MHFAAGSARGEQWERLLPPAKGLMEEDGSR